MAGISLTVSDSVRNTPARANGSLWITRHTPHVVVWAFFYEYIHRGTSLMTKVQVPIDNQFAS